MNHTIVKRLLLYSLCAVIIAFLMVPIILIMVLSVNDSQYLSFPLKGFSLQWYAKILAEPQWFDSIVTSVKVALWVTVTSTILGVMTAFAMVRGEFKAKKLVYALVLSPIIIPGIITAISMYFFFAAWDMVGSLVGVVIGHTVLALPIAVMIITSTLQGVNRDLEKAALSLGADPFTVFRRITLPLMAPGGVSAALFSFLTSFDELLIPLYIAGHEQTTLPVQIWQTVLFGLEPTITAVSGLCIIVTILVLVIADLLGRKNSCDENVV